VMTTRGEGRSGQPATSWSSARGYLQARAFILVRVRLSQGGQLALRAGATRSCKPKSHRTTGSTQYGFGVYCRTSLVSGPGEADGGVGSGVTYQVSRGQVRAEEAPRPAGSEGAETCPTAQLCHCYSQ